MPLTSALEDFERTTLQAVPGVLGKLRYMAELHDGQGGYVHWGMGRVYGEPTARRAIRSSHSAVITQLLKTPLRDLMNDLARSAAAANLTPGEFLYSVERVLSRAVPPGTVPAAQKHFMAVLHALSAVVQSQARANLPNA